MKKPALKFELDWGEKSYQQIVNYISQQENRPAILIQRRTYEELNTLLANGDADVAFSSTGAYAAYQAMSLLNYWR